MASTSRARTMREALVRKLERRGAVSTPSVVEAMRLVPREDFVPGASLENVYDDSEVEIVGRRTDALQLSGHERVLEIGTGSGYQAAVLSLIAREVLSVEGSDALATAATGRLAELGYANVRVRAGDGAGGWLDEAPFDRIIVNAAVPRVPRKLVDQLADGGILVAVIGEPDGPQPLLRVTKRVGELFVEEVQSCLREPQFSR